MPCTSCICEVTAQHLLCQYTIRNCSDTSWLALSILVVCKFKGGVSNLSFWACDRSATWTPEQMLVHNAVRKLLAKTLDRQRLSVSRANQTHRIVVKSYCIMIITPALGPDDGPPWVAQIPTA